MFFLVRSFRDGFERGAVHYDLDACLDSLLSSWWDDPDAGCAILSDGVVLATLSTVLRRSGDDWYDSGVVSVSRFDGPTPRHPLYAVEYRRAEDGSGIDVAVRQIGETEFMNVTEGVQA